MLTVAQVNLTNMLWVEQPVGTGFSIGKANATNELDISSDFVKFFKNFQVGKHTELSMMMHAKKYNRKNSESRIIRSM